MLLQEKLAFKDVLFDGPTKRKLFHDRSREQIFTGISDRYAKIIVGPARFLPVRSDGPAYFNISVVCTNPVHVELYSIQHYVIKLSVTNRVAVITL